MCIHCYKDTPTGVIRSLGAYRTGTLVTAWRVCAHVLAFVVKFTLIDILNIKKTRIIDVI